MKMVPLGELIEAAPVRRAGDGEFPLLSMTMHEGLVDQSAKFKKRIASADTSSYKVIARGQLVVGFPIDEGVLDFQMLYDEGIVSPAYGAWNLKADGVDRGFLKRFLRSPQAMSYYKMKLRGSTARRRSLPNEAFLGMPVPMPSLPEQRRIAAILDKADALRAKRRQSLAHLDSLTQSIFHEMFGDPASNPRGWRLTALGSLADKFSDGPFGSNLKSSHYVSSGVPVIRLQNIGVGRYLDAEPAFISEEHYEGLAKHDCRAGDVVIATLGDPNLRACIVPDSMPRALNKADCVQMRVDERQAHPEFIVSLINAPGTMAKAQALAMGQTRSRVSMGRLKGLEVPVPPLPLQHLFAANMAKLKGASVSMDEGLTDSNRLFSSLQSRAFRGEL